VAQSDGVVRLTIFLSVDGHPKRARGRAPVPARSQQLPTAVSPPQIVASLFYAGLFMYRYSRYFLDFNTFFFGSIKIKL